MIKETKKIFYILVISILIGSCSTETNNQNSLVSDESSGSLLSEANISFRISPAQWMNEQRFSELLVLFKENNKVTDEITLFSSATHAPIPLEEFERRAKIFKDRLAFAKEQGYRTGVNILTSIGHHNEDLEHSLKGNFTFMTGIDGNVSHGSFCPNDENLLDYVRKIYTLTTNSNPDYIWIDDDVRLGHKPIGYGCFCDNCLNIFEEEFGKLYSRKSLNKAFNEGSMEEKIKVREQWLQHNRNSISNLFEIIEETVHEIDPKMPLGFMTGDRFFEGYAFAEWANILAGPNNSTVMWRPGGGNYVDTNTNGFIDKAHAMGRQVSALPSSVLSIQSEIENFPYQRLKKAANIVALEAGTYIAAGCTGAAFNVLSFYNEPLDEYEPLIQKLADSRRFFDLMVQKLGRIEPTGINVYWNKNSYLTASLENGEWLNGGSFMAGSELFNIGLPPTYSQRNANVTLLSGNGIYAIPDEELINILSEGVYIDAEALRVINDRGLGHLTGFTTAVDSKVDRIELFSDHFLNGEYAGRERNNRQSFWKSTAYSLKKSNEKAQILSSLIDYSRTEMAGATMGIFENELGGRVCISGYYPWTFMENLSKSSQMKSVLRWLSNDELPGYVNSFHRINLWIREPQDDHMVLAFTNSSFDEAKNVELKLRTTLKSILVYDMNGNSQKINSSGQDGPYRKFIIPEVDPWQVRLVEVKE